MPPRAPQYEESIFSHISKGFFFAVGFTPAFLVMCAVVFFAVTHATIGGLEQVNSDKVYQKRVARIIEHSPPMQELKQVLPQLQVPVAEIGPAHSLSAKEQQEKACNMAILQFSQTNSDSDKQRMYQLCPE